MKLRELTRRRAQAIDAAYQLGLLDGACNATDRLLECIAEANAARHAAEERANRAESELAARMGWMETPSQ